jgi:putative salt-induced outer membrane protein YdiY
MTPRLGRSPKRPHAVVPRLAVTVGALAALATAARADRVTVKGTTLEGTVTGVTAKHVEMKTVYGEGTLTIPVADVEAITTDGRVFVVYGDGRETVGRVFGIRDGALLVGDDPEHVTAVELAAVHRVLDAGTVETSRLGALRRTFSLWAGNVDLSFAATQATTDTTALGIGFRAVRAREPTRLILESAYRYSTQEQRNEVRETITDSLSGLARGEYDFRPRWYAFGSADALYDAIQKLSYRVVPKAGVGYKLVDTEVLLWSAELGFAYVFERFFGGDTNDFASIAVGSELGWTLPYDATLRARADYLPALNDPADYLLRGQLSLAVPLVDFLAFKVSLVDEYDSTPAADTDRNSLATLVGLSLLF